MARRTIQECDLSKAECDPEDIVKITIKKAGKKEGRTYELSSASAAKLEQQLVAGQPLGPDWIFSSSVPQTKNSQAKTLADLEAEETDEQFVVQKKRELKDAGIDLDREETIEEPVFSLSSNDDDCRHINKGRIQTTLKNKRRYAYRTCKDCGKKLPEMTSDQRKEYMTGKVPEGIKITDLTE